MNRLDFFLGGVVHISPRIYAKTKKYKNDQTRKCFGTASTPPPLAGTILN